MTTTIINRCEFHGFLGKDPTFGTTKGGDEVANLRLATNPADIPDGQGGWTKRKADWIDVAVFKPKAIAAIRSMKQGDGIRVVAGAGLRDAKPDITTVAIRKEISLSVGNRYPGQGVWSWNPRAEREASQD